MIMISNVRKTILMIMKLNNDNNDPMCMASFLLSVAYHVPDRQREGTRISGQTSTNQCVSSTLLISEYQDFSECPNNSEYWNISEYLNILEYYTSITQVSLQLSSSLFLSLPLMVSFCLSKNYVKRGQTDASDAHSLFIQLKTMSTNKSGSPQDNSPNLGIDFMTQ